MASKEDMEIVTHLWSIGCCKRCSLRMLCKNVNFLNYEEFLPKDEDANESKTKKMKSNPCLVCLDLLEDNFLTTIVDGIPRSKIMEYDSDTYICYVSIPASILIREHSTRHYIKEKFPKFYSEFSTFRPMNKVWKACIEPKLSSALNKKLDSNSLLVIMFNLNYEFEKQEVLVMTKLDANKYNHRIKHARKCNNEVFSRKAIEDSLSSLDAKVIREHLELPPLIPTKTVTCNEVNIHSEPIFIAGRYCKYSRTMGQTPWINDDVEITSCVQDCIFTGIEKVLRFKQDCLTFSASGREDYDVRCLGKGRPFYIQVDDPKLTKISFSQFRELENEVNLCKDVSVRDLQCVAKKDLKHIKDGEQFKTKHYTALCKTNSCDINRVIDVLNSYGSFEIQQKTPLRVLHRRTLSIRKKRIHEMKAKRIDGKSNLFILEVVTEAGTYVKELVHGDLHRTTPSIRDIIKEDVDIVGLDVESIDLDWPPEINDPKIHLLEESRCAENNIKSKESSEIINSG